MRCEVHSANSSLKLSKVLQSPAPTYHSCAGGNSPSNMPAALLVCVLPNPFYSKIRWVTENMYCWTVSTNVSFFRLIKVKQKSPKQPEHQQICGSIISTTGNLGIYHED